MEQASGRLKARATSDVEGFCGHAARTTIWAAGVRASGLGAVLAERAGAPLDRSGRVVVEAGLTLPGLAPVAIQQARYVAKAIQARLRGSMPPPFRYLDPGSLPYIVGFENRLLVFIQWAFSYFTFNRRARLITGPSPLPFKHSPQARDRIARSRHG